MMTKANDRSAKYTSYCVVEAPSSTALEFSVRAKMNTGTPPWQPLGAPVFQNPYWYQAMVQPVKAW